VCGGARKRAGTSWDARKGASGYPTGSYATGGAAGVSGPTFSSTDAFYAVPTAEPTTVLAPYAIAAILVPGACSSPTGYRDSSATGAFCLDAYSDAPSATSLGGLKHQA